MRKWLAILLVICVSAGCFGGCSWNETIPPDTVVKEPVVLGFQFDLPEEGEEIAVIRTENGDMYVRLFPEQAPKAVENFKTLAKSGYYDGVLFHRIVEDMFVQTGDPTGTGTGGESAFGGWFEDEISDVLGHFRGSLAMANGGKDLNGSQFFINHAGVKLVHPSSERKYYEAHKEQLSDFATFEEYFAAKTEYITNDTIAPEKLTEERLAAYDTYGGNIALDGNVKEQGGYTVFGQIFYGMNTLDTIAASEVDANNRPTQLVCIDTIDFAVFRKDFYAHIVQAQTDTLNTVKETEEPFGFQTEAPKAGEEIAVIHTNIGDLSLRLFPDHAPKAVENFKALVKENYYDGVKLTAGNGLFAVVDEESLTEAHDGELKRSSFGELFEDEFCTSLGNLCGAVSMTNGGPDTNGVRFFINSGAGIKDTIVRMREAFETVSDKTKKLYVDFSAYFADQGGLDIGRVTENTVAMYEQYGGNVGRDGAHCVTGGHTVFAQVFAGTEKIATMASGEAQEDVVIDSIELITYEG